METTLILVSISIITLLLVVVYLVRKSVKALEKFMMYSDQYREEYESLGKSASLADRCNLVLKAVAEEMKKMHDKQKD